MFFGEPFPKREELLAQLEHVVAKHPDTTFIGAHFGNNAEDIASVGRWLDRYPNFFVDIDARISELGRQPYSTRRFLIKHQDRVMFGTDTPPNRDAFRIYYRFLETDDEYFDCAASHHLQGFWMIDGIDLPKDVLEKIYTKNAERVLYPAAAPPAVAQTAPAAAPATPTAPPPATPVMHVRATKDFEVTGDGSNAAWNQTEWVNLTRRSKDGHPYDARVKMLHSPQGLYVLFTGSDRQLTAKLNEDFLDLWNEDVFEFFLWPDERQSIYFEYEISPLGFELPILVPNVDGKFLGWRPWHYEGDRRTRKATHVSDGAKQSAQKSPAGRPRSSRRTNCSSRWQACRRSRARTGARNFYRVDYDDGRETSWDWARVGPSFHEFQKFGTLIFD